MNCENEKRAHKRISVKLSGYLILEYTTYAASIKNISKHGLSFVVFSMQSPVIFKSESNIEIVLQTSAEEKLKLSGKKK